MKATPVLLTLLVCLGAATAQTPAPAPAGRIRGEVTAIDGQTSISLKSDAGAPVAVTLTDKTRFLRIPAGETDVKKATRLNFSDIAVGDRVLTLGQVSDDQKAVTATMLIVVSKADIAKMQQKRLEEWQQRGVTGLVTSVDAEKKSFVVNTRTREGVKPLTVETGDRTAMWRYAPDSIRFSDAKPGVFSDVKTGDQARILGDKSADGATVKAEQIISGAFRQVAGQVVSVNAAAGEIRITDLQTKKPLVVKVNEDSSLKKLPPMAAAMLARRLNPSAAPTVPAGAGGPGGGGGMGGANPGMRGGGGGGAGGDMQQMLERMPALTLAELKPGDDILVSATSGSDPGRITAISVISGVEPIIRAAPERGTSFGGWSFGEIGIPQ